MLSRAPISSVIYVSQKDGRQEQPFAVISGKNCLFIVLTLYWYGFWKTVCLNDKDSYLLTLPWLLCSGNKWSSSERERMDWFSHFCLFSLMQQFWVFLFKEVLCPYSNKRFALIKQSYGYWNYLISSGGAVLPWGSAQLQAVQFMGQGLTISSFSRSWSHA